MEGHISDTCTMHWEIYLRHRQSGRTLLSGGCTVLALHGRKSASKHIQTDRARITEKRAVQPTSLPFSFCHVLLYRYSVAFYWRKRVGI